MTWKRTSVGVHEGERVWNVGQIRQGRQERTRNRVKKGKKR